MIDIKGSVDQKIYNDVWLFFKNYYGVKQDDEESWDKLIKEGDGLCKKYNNGTFVRELVLAVINELERLSKEVQGNAETQQGI